MKTHRTYRILTTLLCCILLLSLGVLPSAATEDLLPQNQAAADETAAALSALITMYDSKDAPSTLPADRTIEALGAYAAEVAALIPSDMARARTEDLRPALSLLYQKGELAAKITWIAYVHGVMEDAGVLYEQYEAVCRDVRAITDEATLAAYADACCIRMNRAVFREKINRLPRELGIEEAHIWDELEAALTEINAIDAPDVDGTAYLAVYQRTRDAIVLAQNRLLAKEELGNVYDLLGLPSADKLSALSALSESLSRADSTTAVNRALLVAASTSLHTALPGDGPYVSAYRQALISAMTGAVSVIGEEGVAELCRYFDGSDTAFFGKTFVERAAVAHAKDQIEAIRLPSDDTALCNLLGTYVQSGGILEHCQTPSEMRFEVMRATRRAEWARQKSAYLSRLEQILPTASVGTLLTAAKSVYAEIDAAIAAIPRTQEDGEAAILALLEMGKGRMENLVCEAEAERYRITHADVLKKEGITEQERDLLQDATTAFDALSPGTQKKLADERRTLNRHNASLAEQQLRTYLERTGASALRREAIGALIARLATMDLAAARPSEFLKETNAICVRAAAIDTLLSHYAETCAAEHYPQYDSDSVTRLHALVTDGLSRLSDPKHSDASQHQGSATLPTVADTLSELLTALERHTAVAELRLCASGSSSARVAELLAEAVEAVLQAQTREAIETLRDGALFRISACRKADEMRRELERACEDIRALRGLGEEQKAQLLDSEAMQGLRACCKAAEEADNPEALRAIATQFANDLQLLMRTAQSDALSAGIQAAVQKMAHEAEAIAQAVRSYQYLSEAARESYAERLGVLMSEWEASMEDPKMTWEILDARLLALGESLSGLAAAALGDQEEGCRQAIRTEWQTQYAHPTHYSEAHYHTVSTLLEQGEISLRETVGVRALLAVRDKVAEQLSLVPNRLDEAKEEAVDALTKAYENMLNNKTCYGESQWAEIENIYRHSLDEIALKSEISDVGFVLNITTERTSLMQAVRMDLLYSHGQSIGSSYPADYRVDTSGLWASLYAPGGIPFGAQFSAMPFAANPITSTLQAAVRRGAVLDADGNPLGPKQLAVLKNAMVLQGLSLAYSAADTAGVSYRISLLLPEEYDTESILGIVFVREDGCVEFYQCDSNESLISFDVSHFSSFYIVSNKAINLSPLIVFLALLLLCEIALILFILLRRRGREQAPTMAAVLSIAHMPLQRKILPQGGLPAVIILGLCVCAATAVLAWLLHDEYCQRKQKARPLALSAPQAEKAAAISAPKTEALLSLAAEPPCSHAEPIAPIPHPTLAEVTAELANTMMSDEEAAQATEKQSGAIARVSGKKAAVNIDVISSRFAPNETVSLSALKQRGLVPKKATAIKILARGTLDKPLTVLANDFSATAIKMILLTGGEAILVERDCVE